MMDLETYDWRFFSRKKYASRSFCNLFPFKETTSYEKTKSDRRDHSRIFSIGYSIQFISEIFQIFSIKNTLMLVPSDAHQKLDPKFYRRCHFFYRKGG